MQFENEGIFLWYETSDAPAPGESVPEGTEVTIEIGVQPADASNIVEVRYRVNQGSPKTVVAKSLPNEPFSQAQYFRATLPALQAGDRVEYTTICRCAGRQVPAPKEAEQWAAEFTVTGSSSEPQSSAALGSESLAPKRAETVKSSELPQHEGDRAIISPPTEATTEIATPPISDRVITQEVIGQLIDARNNLPLSGFTVRGSMLTNSQELEALGYDITNGRGYFALTYTTPKTEASRGRSPRRLQLEILNPQGEAIHQTAIGVPASSEEILEIRVPVPQVPEPPSPTLTEIANLSRSQLSSQLVSTLANRGIRTLADFIKARGTNNLPELSEAVNDAAVQTLETHANLSTLSDDLRLNATLIDRGFSSVAQIARASRADFVSALGDQLGDFKAAQMQVKARAQNDFLNNVAASISADLANGFPNPLLSDADTDSGNAPNANFEDIFNPTCSCQNCEAATSPVAYLANLLDYATAKVKKNDIAITLADLGDLFHQPFGKLPASCEIQQQQVRQVRLCIEVLRSFLNANPPTAVSKTILKQTEKQYRLNAYQILLNQIGTSYDELRQIRGNSEEQEALAKRLGIALNKLDFLFLDPDAEQTEPKAITESTLEKIFGLMATNRNPLDSVNKRGDPLGQIISWNLQGVELGQNTDPEGFLHLSLVFIPGITEYLWVVNVFSDRERTQKVAGGVIRASQGEVELVAEGNSGLSGSIVIDYKSDSHEIEIYAPGDFQGLLNWRLEYLRTLWQEEDWPQEPDNENPLAEEILGITLPIIDPDLIRLAYLTNWSNSDDPAYQLWQARQEWIEGQLEGLRTYTQDLAGFEHAIVDKLLLPDVLPADETETLLEYLYNQRETGNDIAAKLDKLSLTNGAFVYLVSVRDLLASSNPVLSSEWKEIYNILLQVQKIRQYETWRTEEKESQVILSSDSFQIPELPPLEFPPPEPQALPNWRVTQQALRNWEDKLQSRIEQEQTIKEALQAAVSATEEATLPMLRDALIMATDAEGSDFDTKADWITKNLLIDAQAGSCQETTRIAQTIETIQGLLWGLKINQLQKTYLDLELGDRENFDETWKWLGSYANWRAAMMVFLYPENILRPELRKWQTPAFRQLVKNVRNNRLLTPEKACQEAKVYSDYFADIATLKVEATCQARTRIHSGDCRDRMAKDSRSLFYMFARGGKTNTVYWSTYDPQDESGYAQTFWEAVPGLESKTVIKILGAVPYRIYEEKRAVYLFLQIQGIDKQKLVLTKYNLELPDWDLEVTELDNLPFEAEDFSAVIEQRDDESKPPRIVICNPKKGVYSLRLDRQGTILENESRLLSSIPTRYIRLLALISRQYNLETAYFLFVNQDYQDWFNVVVFYDDASLAQQSMHVANNGNWAGAFLASNSSDIYAFFDFDTYAQYNIVDFDDQGRIDVSNSYSSPINSNLESIAIRCGEKNSKLRIAYNIKPKGVYQSVLARKSDSLLEQLFHSRVAPRVVGPLSITEQVNDSKLHFNRCIMEQVFKDNEVGSQSNLTYIKEIYYFVPIYLALQLQQQRYFQTALNWYRTVYAYNLTLIDPNESTNGNQPNFCATPPEDQPKIYHGLKLEESLPEVYKQAEDWLRDPFNPHLIATTRKNTYTRFTLLSIIRCFLEYADDEFTRDTVESVPRARTLYLTALELLERLKQKERSCKQFIDNLNIDVNNQLKIDAPELLPIWHQIKGDLLEIKDNNILKNLVEQIENTIASEESWIIKLINVQTIVNLTLNLLPQPPNFTKLIEQKSKKLNHTYAALLAKTEVSNAVKKVGDLASKDYLDAVSIVSGITTQALEIEKIKLPWLRQKTISQTTARDRVFASTAASAMSTMRADYREIARYNPIASTHIATLAQMAKTYPLQGIQITKKLSDTYIPSLTYSFCIPLNPVLDSLRLWAALNLYKLRTCRNIAGIERELNPYAAPTDTLSGLPQIGAGGQLILPGSISFPATPYRYAVLIDRAKQLVSIAQQIEASFLSALEKLDAELYNLLKARQDIQLTRAGVRLQDLRVREAESGVDLAELQRERSQIQVDHYENLLRDPINNKETASLFLLGTAAAIYGVAAGREVVKMGLTVGLLGEPGLAAQAASTTASLLSQWASYERREQEWRFQEKLAQQDVRIGNQQVTIAQDRVRVAGQERIISQIQADFAEETLNFLTTKFTNVDLYDWMVAILEQVYSFFLQQATATAKLAENQLAFERQEVPPAYIQANYWEVPNNNFSSGSQNDNTPDRRGLTGSARLLQDIYQLDQYAFETDRRKLQLTKTISLARLAPAEFQSFRETGVMLFSTVMELFDRDFPGHYLCLIKRVRTSIVALIPPTEGIKATLSTTGISRVVIGQNNTFQSVEINRPPESVALTSPQNATGLFELAPQSQEMLLPFESMGVDTSWELRLPKASNFFDYSTIADVLITIEYTALNSFTYRQQVIQKLGNNFSGDRPFSFRNEFSDQWFDLNNPDQTATPMVVRFETRREDFPLNLEDLSIQHIVLYFARIDGASFEVPATLNFTEKGNTESIGGGATTTDGIMSTRRGNASSWIPMIGKRPFGQWELAFPDEPGDTLPDNRRVRDLFEAEEIEDILLVITYQGRTPPWPA